MNNLLKLGNLVFFFFLFLVSRAQTNYEDYKASETIFTDDFSTNNIGWVTGVSSDNCYNSKINDGAFEITSACKGIYPSYWMTRIIDVTRDFEIEANILYVQGESDNGISLVWGKDDNYHRFNFEISGNGYFKIFQFNGNYINLKDWTVSDLIKKSDYNKLTVRKIAAQYFFYLNEKLVYSSDFYPFYGNQIGFQDNQNTTMRVDNLKVSYLKPASSFLKTTEVNSEKVASNTPYTNTVNNGIILQPFIGVSADFIILTGNFDGQSLFSLPESDQVILVPKLSPGPGFGVQFGIRSKHVEVDWAYNLSMMKYTSLDAELSGTSTNHFIRLLGVKGYLGQSVDKKVKPYIYFDWSLAISHFENLSYLSTESNKANATSANYMGMIVGLGIGLQYNVVKNLAFDLRILPEYYFGTDVKSKGFRDYPIKKFNNFLLVSSIGINYYFNKK